MNHAPSAARNTPFCGHAVQLMYLHKPPQVSQALAYSDGSAWWSGLFCLMTDYFISLHQHLSPKIRRMSERYQQWFRGSWMLLFWINGRTASIHKTWCEGATRTVVLMTPVYSLLTSKPIMSIKLLSKGRWNSKWTAYFPLITGFLVSCCLCLSSPTATQENKPQLKAWRVGRDIMLGIVSTSKPRPWPSAVSENLCL